MSSEKKVLFIMGGSSEVGISLIKSLSDQYDHIIAHYNKSATSLIDIQNTLGDKIILLQADFNSEDGCNELITRIKERELIPTHIICLSATKFRQIKFSKMKWELFQHELNVSYRSVVMILNAFLPLMVKRKQGKVIIMLSSCTLNVPPKYISYYVSIKYALLGLVKALAAEYADKGITINGISPEMMETNFLSEIPELIIEKNALSSPFGRNLMVKEIIPAFDFLLSDGGDRITGQNIGITGGKDS